MRTQNTFSTEDLHNAIIFGNALANAEESGWFTAFDKLEYTYDDITEECLDAIRAFNEEDDAEKYAYFCDYVTVWFQKRQEIFEEMGV